MVIDIDKNSQSKITLNDCFSELCKEDINYLRENSNVLPYKKGEMIVRQNFSASHLYLLEKGLVNLSVFDDHKISTVKLITPDNFIGIMCSFASKKLDFSATALQNSEVRLIEGERFKELLTRNGEFAYKFIQHISTLTNEMVHWIMRIKGRNVDGALALILTEFAEIYGSNRYDLPVTRKELASIIGYSKESIINTLSTLNKDNVINVSEKHIEIIDPTRLESIIQNG